MKLLDKICSKKYDDIYEIITVLGIKIKRRSFKKQFEKLEAKMNKFIFNSFQRNQTTKILAENRSYPECIEDKLKKITKSPKYLFVDKRHNYLNYLLGFDKIKYTGDIELDGAYLSWEIRPENYIIDIITFALNVNREVLFVGDSFLRSIDTRANDKAEEKYVKGISFTFDDLTSYFDATQPSRMELLLNDKNLVITEEQRKRARKCIDRIIETHLTKYNHQPIYEPEIGRKGVKKVLVVDQSYSDMSILKGWGSDETFEKMLNKAIEENPDADIIVKTHPDTMTGNRGGYYTGLKQHDNIYTQTTPINPISLIKYVDKVYVCSTQFGFEALMCGKEVHVFGMPFYAGWGLTVDDQKCERRTNTRTLEEMFYIAYIMYSYYVNPETKVQCEIEDAMDYLLKLRGEYFQKVGE